MAYCSKCGAQVPDDSSFCPKCGAEIGPAAPGGFDRHMDRQIRRQMRREWRWGLFMSPEYRLVEVISAGVIIILLGVLLYLAAAGITSFVTWSNVWAYLLIGVGAFLVLRAILAMVLLPKTYYHFGGIIGGIILIAIGAAWLSVSVYGWDRPFWPLIIIGGGVLVIAVGVANYLARVKG